MPDDFGGVPELTLSLRSLGSGRARARDEQARFFAPLLEARRRAADARTAGDAIAAFNVSRLGAALDELVHTMATQRHPGRPPAQRAFEAALAEAVEPFYAALRALRERTPSSGVSLTREEWEGWIIALRGTFEAADRSWSAVDALLVTHPLPGAGRREG